MAPATDAPQSTTSCSSPPHTPRATSIPDDSSTEYAPTPVHSPGGPQYEDLPPSYDFALSDAHNGVAALDASQIEAHRVSVNEGPNEAEVWEYRMRGEGGEESQEHEEAPAYEGVVPARQVAPRHEGVVPVQHITGSQSIPVGRVGDFNASASTSTRAGSAAVDDPPHSIPGTGESVHGEPAGSQGGHRGQGWGPFGAPGNGPFGAGVHGPFGAPGNGPFGAPGNGPFGLGRGFRGDGHGRGRGRRGRGSRSSQDWAAFGQNMGKWGEDFGRKMGTWGEQFGRQAGAMGKQFGQRSEQWASAYSAGGGGYNPPVRPMPTAGPSTAEPSGPPQYDHPPSYEAPAGFPGQESGVLNRSFGANEYPPEKMPEPPFDHPSVKSAGKQKSKAHDDDDDDDDSSDSSSISSDSSLSSLSSSSEDGDESSAQATFLARLASITKAADLAISKGKKPREEIAHERDMAIAKATREKEAADHRRERAQARRTQKRNLKSRKRELTREYRRKKAEVKEGSAKGKGKARKGGWRALKRAYRADRRALKREGIDAKRAWKRERRGWKQRGE